LVIKFNYFYFVFEFYFFLSLDKQQNVKPNPSALSSSRNNNYFDNNDNGPLSEEASKSLETPDYSGWLKKQGDKYKTWKSRYCILKGVYLYYFKNDKVNLFLFIFITVFLSDFFLKKIFFLNFTRRLNRHT
jgi:hypothetical protein